MLPTEDVGLGPLVALASELNLGAGPMDLLATDAHGRLVIIEFKRGAENPDVREVVAQVLDYGSTLWRFPYDELERRCQSCKPNFQESLGEHVGHGLDRLDEAYDDDDGFQAGIARCLEAGSFVFMYVGRDLDDRTRRIMTFLAEGARMTFFAVEVDQFHAGDTHTSVLVPRTAFVPWWVNPPISGVTVPDAETLLLMERMDALAKELHLQVAVRRTGRVLLPLTLEPVPFATSGAGVYASQRGMEINLKIFGAYGEDAKAAQLLTPFGAATGINLGTGYTWPAVKCDRENKNWDRVRLEVLIPYFQARLAHASMTPDAMLAALVASDDNGSPSFDVAPVAEHDVTGRSGG